MKKISGVDLFCGIGGLTYGLQQTGVIKINAGIDNDLTCKYAFEINNKSKFLYKDIKEVTKEDLLPYFDKDCYKLIAGCAPCQPYSSHQKNKDLNNRSQHSKYGLIMQLLRLVQEIEPEFVTMENVPHLEKDPLLQEFLQWFTDNSYHIHHRVVDISKYGAPQKRKRFVFIASKLGIIEIPKGNIKPLLIKDVIGNLLPIAAGEQSSIDPLHVSSDLSELNIKRIKASKPDGTWKDWPIELLPNCYKKESGKSYLGVYGRLNANKPAPTLTTQFTRYGTGRYGHYEQNRALSLREGALLQTFPKYYDFGIKAGISKTDIAKHIGNAVPPILGKLIGELFKDSILNP